MGKQQGINRRVHQGDARRAVIDIVSLTENEKAVLRLVSREWTSRQIAQELGSTKAAVDSLCKTAVRRLGAHDRFDAVERAIARGELSERYRRRTIPNPLTVHQCRLLAGFAEGQSINELAAGFGNSRHTIDSALRIIRQKLGAESVAEAWSKARRWKLVDRNGKRMARVRHDVFTKLHTRRVLSFTAREQQALEAFARTRDNKRLSRELNVAEKTVAHYWETLERKLGVADRLSVVLRSRELGLVQSVTLTKGERLGLGDREMIVLDALRRGRRTGDIARSLGVEEGSVRTLIGTALLRLGARSVKEALERYAMKGERAPAPRRKRGLQRP